MRTDPNPATPGTAAPISPSARRGGAASALVGAGLVLLTALVGCGTAAAGPPATQSPGSSTMQPGGPAQQPVATGETDWAGVAQALGRSGTLTDTVYRVALPRSDLAVTTQGVAIKPGLSLGGYAAFTRYPDTAMMMGDLVVTEAELPAFTDALQANGIAQTAQHKHLLEQSPSVWWTHVYAMGDPVQIARGLAAALAVTATPPAAAPAPAGGGLPPDFNAAAVAAALGRTGTADGGIYKVTVPRNQTVTEDAHVLPAGLGLTTSVNFQPMGGGKAATNGDIAMTSEEIQNVIAALRRGGIQVVTLHNHGVGEQPRLFYLHFWGVNDAVALAGALRPALEATNLKPAG